MELQQVFNLRDYLTTQPIVDVDIDWNWVEMSVEAFKDAYKANLRLQQEHLHTAIFLYCEWSRR